MSTSEGYVIFEVYYKHGEYDVKEFSDQSRAEHYLRKKAKLDDYDEWEGKKYSLEQFDDDEVDFEDLVEEMKRFGRYVLETDAGYGVVAVVCGETVEGTPSEEPLPPPVICRPKPRMAFSEFKEFPDEPVPIQLTSEFLKQNF